MTPAIPTPSALRQRVYRARNAAKLRAHTELRAERLKGKVCECGRPAVDYRNGYVCALCKGEEAKTERRTTSGRRAVGIEEHHVCL